MRGTLSAFLAALLCLVLTSGGARAWLPDDPPPVPPQPNPVPNPTPDPDPVPPPVEPPPTTPPHHHHCCDCHDTPEPSTLLLGVLGGGLVGLTVFRRKARA